MMRVLLVALFSITALVSAQQYSLQQYLNIRSVGGTSLSPDGTECVFLWNVSGTNQVWKTTKDVPWPQQLTSFEDRILFVSWQPSGDRLLFGKDAGGNERTQLYLLASDGSRIDTLTNKPTVIYNFGGWSRDGKWICYGSNERDEKYFDIYIMEIATRKSTLIYEHDGNNTASGFSPDGKYVLITRAESGYNSDIFAIDVRTKTAYPLTKHSGDVRNHVASWSPDSRILYITTDEGSDYLYLASIDLTTKARAIVKKIDHDISGYSITRTGMYELTITNIDGMNRVEIRNRKSNKLLSLPDQTNLRGVSISENEKNFLLHYASSTSVGEYFLYDPGTRKRQQILWSSYSGISPKSFVEPKSVSYPSFDQKNIPGFLYLPTGAKKERSLPCIVIFHGGPEGQSTPAFNSLHQYFVSRGYAVFLPNIRGSTGYGKSFLNADNARKRKDAIEDGARAVEYLRGTGYINPNKIIAYGGSYGGYMTLAQVAFHPNLWAAGIDIVGISNFASFLKNTGAWRARHRAAEYGDPIQDAEFLRSVSPLNYVDQITAPLFVIQGANDPRVPKSEADQIVERIKTRGGIVEYLLFPDEGHGLAKLKNRISAYGEIMNFLDKHVKTK